MVARGALGARTTTKEDSLGGPTNGSKKPVQNHDCGLPHMAAMTEMMHREYHGMLSLSLWKRVGVIIAESVVDERDGVEAVARIADALEMHEVDGPQPEHNDHGGVSLRKDHAQASGSDPLSATDGGDACGGESWPNNQGRDQSWKEFRDGDCTV